MGNKTRIAVLEARMEERKEQLALASEALTIRLEHSNGLIKLLERQSTEKATKAEVAVVLERVQTLERGAATGAGKSAGIGAVIALILSLAALAASFWK